MPNLSSSISGRRANLAGVSTRLGKLLVGLAIVLALPASSGPAFAGGDVQDWDKVLKQGNDELAQGMTEKAISFFEGKCKKYPLSGACHCALGKSLKRLGKISEGKEELRKATDLDPNYPPAWYELGVMLESDRDYNGAVAAFDRFLGLNQDQAQRKLVEDRIRFCKEHM